MPDLTSTLFLANLIGFGGYLLFALSPLAHDRIRYLVLHGIAMLPIAAHYIMLGAAPGAALSFVYLFADIIGIREKVAKSIFLLLGLLAIGMLAFTYQSAADLMGLVGTLIFIASRAANGHRTTLAIAALSTVTWGIYGWTQLSYSQVIFSGAYAVSCLYRLWRSGPTQA